MGRAAALANRPQTSARPAPDVAQSAARAAGGAGRAGSSGGARQALRRKSEPGRRLSAESRRGPGAGSSGAGTVMGVVGGGACDVGGPRAGAGSAGAAGAGGKRGRGLSGTPAAAPGPRRPQPRAPGGWGLRLGAGLHSRRVLAGRRTRVSSGARSGFLSEGSEPAALQFTGRVSGRSEV